MGNLRNIIRFGWPYLKKYRGRLFAGISLGVLFGLVNASFVWGTKTIIGRVSAQANSPTAELGGNMLPGFIESLNHSLNVWIDPWLPLAGRALDWQQVVGGMLLFPLLVALRGYLGFLSSYCLAWVGERVINDLRVDVLRKLTSLSLGYFNKATMGDMVTRVDGDTASLHRCLSLGISDAVKEPITIVSVLVSLCFINFKLAVFTLFFLPLCILPVIILGRKLRRNATSGIKVGITKSSLLIEALSGIRLIKAYGLEDRQIASFRGLSNQLVKFGVKQAQAKEQINPIIETIAMIGFGALIVYSIHSQVSVSDIAGFMAGVILIMVPLKRVSLLHALFQQTRFGIDRLAAIFSEQPTVRDPSQPKPLAQFRGKIAFENVSFAYAERLVVTQLNLEIAHGKKLGIAGESGSGKSTLMNLLLRFHDPTDGRITIDGLDFLEIQQHELRQQIALVSQEVVIFDQTAAENIACGKTNATRAEVEAAAKQAYAHEFIMQLPQGYDTRIGERGMTLSGGQRQRLAIARAFVRNAPILLLDEATASLDSNAETEVQNVIDQLSQSRTVICIAHRLSTLAMMDHIIVMSEGRIVEQGGYQELLQKSGAFSKMARRQGLTGRD